MSDSDCQKASSLIMGIDVGTTSVKVVLIDQNGDLIENQTKDMHATIPSDLGSKGHEQDVHKICSSMQMCVSHLSRSNLQKVCHIGISGQMHGLVLWKSGHGWVQNEFGRFDNDASTSNLFTWQDRRCDENFLEDLPSPTSHLKVSTGHGCSTLFWLQKNRPEFLSQFDCAGTIMDFLVSMLCNLEKPKMSYQIAASWGYFDTKINLWDYDLLKDNDFPTHLLPDVVESWNIAGNLGPNWYGVPEHTPITCGLGDLQCSIFSIIGMDKADVAVCNISTSAQLSYIMPEGYSPREAQKFDPVEYFPYFENRYIAVAASLNGGNVLSKFVKNLRQWSHELGFAIPTGKHMKDPCEF